MVSPDVPSSFDSAFLDWFRERTEVYWASLPVRTPEEILAEYVKAEIGGREWQPGTRWLGGIGTDEISEIEGRWRLRFPADYRLFLQELGAPDRSMFSAAFVDRSDAGAARGLLPLDLRRRFRSATPVEPDRSRGELARVRYGRRQDMVLTEEPSFYDWSRDLGAISGLLDWIVEGLEFDVECNGLWAPSWGEKPATLAEQTGRLRELVEEAPKLIPVYGHRCLVEKADDRGNPVLSIWQSDIIVYGNDLRDYLLHDFGYLLGLSDEMVDASRPAWSDDDVRRHEAIPFWGELLALNAGRFDEDD